jgi:N4-bis(aminopropyl)spermidine synthase
MTDAASPEFAALVEARGVGARPLGVLVRLLAGEGTAFDDLVRSTALPRRVVEAAVAALGPDVEESEGRLRFVPARAAAYGALVPDVPPSPAGLLAAVRAAVEAAPRPKRELDHVSATPETVARRAEWLAEAFALSGRRVLCVGDHDLTSVALALVDPAVEVTVADMDEDVLAHVAAWPATRGRIRAVFADFRLGLPARLRRAFDLVVTDPPYTPDGIALFARRGLEALADHGPGRLVVAYGYGDQPGLGLNGQEALAELKLVYEAVLPAFNRYDGAQAIGSASNLYVLRPTAGTRKALAAAGRPGRANVYTHGSQSSEGGVGPVADDELAALMTAAQAGAGEPPAALAVGDAWPARFPGGARRVPLAGCLAPESPESSPCSAPTVEGEAMIADLRHDAGPLLLRLLLATRAARVAVLVRNAHPDIADAAGQEALSSLVGDALSLRYRRSTPSSRLAIVEATRVPPPDPAGGRPGARAAAARRHVLDRPHAKLANACREALIRTSTTALTKNEARARVATHVTSAGVDTSLSLLELPRAQLATLLSALTGVP